MKIPHRTATTIFRRPDYDEILLADLFVVGGDLNERQNTAQTTIVNMLKPYEEEFLDIFKYYAQLKQIK